MEGQCDMEWKDALIDRTKGESTKNGVINKWKKGNFKFFYIHRYIYHMYKCISSVTQNHCIVRNIE